MLVVVPGVGQTSGVARGWSYAAVSVRPDKSTEDGVRVMMGDDAYTAENVRIVNVVSQAYGIKQDLIFGLPGWADGAHFDIEAKLSSEDAAAFAKLGRDEKGAAYKDLLRRMLEERFGLRAHVESRQMPVYDLLIAKGGVKMRASGGDDDPKAAKGADGKALRGLARFGNGLLVDQGIEISGLVGQLINLVHRAVVDKTGLTGRYDFTLRFAPEGAGPEEDAPSIFAAVEEQLGLKLQAGKGPVEVLVVERVERPAGNYGFLSRVMSLEG